MNTVAFDTLAFSKRLQEAGVPAVQAEAHASAQADFLTHHLLSEVATKDDLKALEVATKDDLRASVAKLEAKIEASVANMEAKIEASVANMEAKIEASVAKLEAKIEASVANMEAKIEAGSANTEVNLAKLETRLTVRMLLMVGALATLMTVFRFID